MEGIQEEAEFDFGDPALLDPTVETSDAIGDVILGSPASSAEATSPFSVDDEVSFLLPGTTKPSQPAKSVAPLQLQSSKNWVTSPSVKRFFMASQSLSQVFEHPKRIYGPLWQKVMTGK